MRVPSVFESFNARLLPTKQLVEDYVPSQHMALVAGRHHSVLVGTRGSGKTTIMRMLQVEAVAIAKLIGAPKELLEVSYYGVYVPTDRMWAKQKDTFLDTAPDKEFAALLVMRLFSLHVLDCMLSALTYRVTASNEVGYKFGKARLTAGDENQLVRNLVDLWELAPVIYSIPALRMAITRHIAELTKKLTSPDECTGIRTEGFPTLELALRGTVSYMNLALQDDEGVWCFLFDELELAPEGTFDQLLALTRGGPTNIIMKLALAPYRRREDSTFDQSDAFDGHDYNTVNLQAGERGLEFARALGDSLLRRKGLPGSIESYFHESAINYRSVIAEYATRDPSLAAYLQRSGIALEQIPEIGESEGAPLLRKIQKNVYLRSRIRTERGKAPRRPLSIFAGFTNFCKALEHNPRLLIAAFSRLLANPNKDGAFSEALQLEVLSSVERKCSAQLGLQPIEGHVDGLRSVRDLIYQIAQTIREEEIGGKTFRPDYSNMFTLERSTSLAIKEAIGIAQNMGMIVEEHIDVDEVSSVKQSLRLSYLFSHRFSIPDIMGRIAPIERYLKKVRSAQLGTTEEIDSTIAGAVVDKGDNSSRQLEFF